VLGTLSNREKSDWRSLAESSQTCARLRCTGLSGVHRIVSGAQAGSPSEQAAFGKNSVHHGYNSPDCLVGQPRPRQRSAAQSAGGAWTSPTVGRPHGLSGVPRAPWLQRSALLEKEGNRALFPIRWGTELSYAPTDRRQLWPSKWSSNGC
jgi:hypothetical protein